MHTYDAHYKWECSQCGETRYFKTFDEHHAHTRNSDGTFKEEPCPSCANIKKMYPDVFEWVQKVVACQVDKHSDYYTHERPSSCGCC